MDKPDGLQIDWEPFDGHAEHTSFYSFDFLRRHASPANLLEFHKEVSAQRWTSQHFASRPDPELSFAYPALLTDPHALHTAYTDLAKYGLIFIRNMPIERVSDAHCELRALAQTFGMLRNTFYGETWDVKNLKNSKNIAYTNLDLGLPHGSPVSLHSNGLGFTEQRIKMFVHSCIGTFKEPPRYQILHCFAKQGERRSFAIRRWLECSIRVVRKLAGRFFSLADRSVAFHYINDGQPSPVLAPDF